MSLTWLQLAALVVVVAGVGFFAGFLVRDVLGVLEVSRLRRPSSLDGTPPVNPRALW